MPRLNIIPKQFSRRIEFAH